MTQNQEEAEVNLDLPEVQEGEEDTTDWKAEATKLREKAIAQRERTKALKEQLKTLSDKKAEQDQSKPDESKLLDKLERMSLRQAGVTHAEDIELARTTAKKWNMDIDEVLADEDFKAKLERQQNARANVQATSKVKGSAGGTSQAKETLEYWMAKGVPPTPADIPDREVRTKIALGMVKAAENGGKTFYND